MPTLKQTLKVLETSAVSGVTAGIGDLAVNGAQLTLKTVAAAGIAALVGFLYQVNRQVGVLEGSTSPVTTIVADASKVIEAEVTPVAKPALVASAGTMGTNTEVFPPKVTS